jgi:hypothetical protein
MSNLGDFIKALTGADSAAIDGAGSLIGIMADLSGAGPFLQFFLDKLLPTENQILDDLNKLQTAVTNGLNQIETEVAAQSLIDKMNAVDIVMDPAKTVFASIPDILPKLPNDAIVNDALQKCLNAVISLRDDAAKWQVAWAPPVAYTDGWSGDLWPPHGISVFSYTYTLAQFLHSIGIFLTVVEALQPISLGRHVQDLMLCTDKLQSVHDTITASTGLTGTRIPTVQTDVADIGGTGSLESWQPDWWDTSQGRGNPLANWAGDPRLWPFGAVETYSGSSIVDSYWPFLPDMIAPGTVADKFFPLVVLRVENRKKLLFVSVGFPAVRQTIRQLQSITGQPISTDLPYESWSLRNALKILGISLNGSGALRSLKTFLQATPPYSGGFLFPISAGYKFAPSPLPKSFRSIFIAPS